MIKVDIQLIELKKIKPYRLKKVAEKTIETRKRIIEKSDQCFIALTVQKDTKGDFYWLIHDDEDYLAYCRTAGRDSVYCNVRPALNETERKIEKLKTMNMPRTTKWIDQHELISELKEEMTLSDIERRSGVAESKLKKFEFHKDVPSCYIDTANQKGEHHGILNRIAKLYLGEPLSKYLYERASLFSGNSYRLKHDQLTQVEQMVEAPGFTSLDIDDQLKLMKRATEFQAILESTWQNDINAILSSYRPPRSKRFIVNVSSKSKRKRMKRNETRT
ncbi:hypothetical protein ACFFSY_33745 [Paenibacillus aurantiacus]|uniref:Uncharacterized protein n=1 Tax=Paenibacillus aurantiacus TaxID=1936118 RepID=A0ABV5L0B3_9BACL